MELKNVVLLTMVAVVLLASVMIVSVALHKPVELSLVLIAVIVLAMMIALAAEHYDGATVTVLALFLMYAVSLIFAILCNF